MILDQRLEWIKKVEHTYVYAGEKILDRDIRVEHPLKLGLGLACSRNGKEASSGEVENEPGEWDWKSDGWPLVDNNEVFGFHSE